MLEQFHFIQPWWLLALLPLALLLWRVSLHNDTNNPWRKIVDARLLPLLMSKQQQGKNHAPIWLLAIGWLLTVLALANPTWEQQPQPVMQTNTSRVIVLDLSRSMLATDLKPSRMIRARFKVEDILAHDDEGQTGLVVFAGDAFSVTPLTRDADTIRAQLKALEPSIMPTQGSRADLGLLKALDLLQQTGIKSGDVILIADGVEGNKATLAATRLQQSGYRVSVLGVGTAAGAPLPNGQGGVTRDSSGKPLLVKLDNKALLSVAQAGGGHYIQLTGNETDINYLLDFEKGTAKSYQSHDLQTQKWKQQGPLLAILLLPLGALAFRRGWLLSIFLCIGVGGLFVQPQPAMASAWDDLWLRNDQQAAQALQKGQYEKAARLAEDPAQRGSAEYKNGDYQKALDAFSQLKGSDAAYNRGNALAKQKKYQEAIAAYNEALKAQPGMKDAVANKSSVEALLKKQQQQQDQSGQQGEQKQQDQSGQQGKQKQQDQSGQQGKNKESPKNEQASSETQAGDKKQQDSSHNSFARANKQLKEKTNKQDDNESGPTTPSASEAEDVKEAQSEKGEQPLAAAHTPAKAEKLTSEEQLAAQQWLRRIPDDPGGLLRRKFLYQYRQRGEDTDNGNSQNW